MIDFTIVSGCDKFICMNIDIGSIIIGLGLGVILMYFLFKKRLIRKKEE